MSTQTVVPSWLAKELETVPASAAMLALLSYGSPLAVEPSLGIPLPVHESKQPLNLMSLFSFR